MRGRERGHSMSNTVKPIDTNRILSCDQFADAVTDEYIKARKKFGPFDNGHEGLAVIWEEFEELKAFVFSKNQTHEQIENARKECIQIAAMAMAFAVELLR
jgi:hypothetical protein